MYDKTSNLGKYTLIIKYNELRISNNMANGNFKKFQKIIHLIFVYI